MIVFFDSDRNDLIKGKPTKLSANNLNKVLSLIAKKIRGNELDKNGYCVIHSSIFKKEYSKYQPYLKFLIVNGYVERSFYEEGVVSYGYRFTNKFKETVSIKRIIERPNTDIRLLVNDDNTTNYIEDYIKERLKLDFLSAKVILDLNQEQLPKTKDEWDRFIDIKKWIDNNMKLYNWKQKKRFCNWSNHRLYTNFFHLSPHIRLNNVQLYNEPLVEFDIRSSFPLMLAKYCLEVNPDIINDHEYIEYCTSVLNGTFYRELAVKLNGIRNCNRKGLLSDKDAKRVSRNDAKTLFQCYLNGNYNKIPYLNNTQYEIHRMMDLNYTKINKIIKDLKDNDIEVYNVLVEMETRLIFKIVKELYDTFDDIRILTCHDAIYVPKSFESRVRDIWESNMRSFTSELPYANDSDVSVLHDTGFIIDCDNSEEEQQNEDDFWDDEVDDDYWDSCAN